MRLCRRGGRRAVYHGSGVKGLRSKVKGGWCVIGAGFVVWRRESEVWRGNRKGLFICGFAAGADEMGGIGNYAKKIYPKGGPQGASTLPCTFL